MFSSKYYQDDPVDTMVKNEVSKIVSSHKEQIIENAAKLLSEKLSLTKAVKEAVQNVIDKI